MAFCVSDSASAAACVRNIARSCSFISSSSILTQTLSAPESTMYSAGSQTSCSSAIVPGLAATNEPSGVSRLSSSSESLAKKSTLRRSFTQRSAWALFKASSTAAAHGSSCEALAIFA